MHALSLSWLGIFRMAGVVSYKMLGMVVARKKEDGRETIVDQQDMDTSKAADLLFKLGMYVKSYQQRDSKH